MKRCLKCKAKKNLDAFYKDPSCKDGLRRWCKKCCRGASQKYGQTDAGKTYRQKYQQKYRQTKEGKEVHLKSVCKQRLIHPEKRKARDAVRYAIKVGRLIRPDHCECCLKKLFAESHHEDYSKPLDVDWLCTKCHSKLRSKV